jgi:hypothetical protein
MPGPVTAAGVKRTTAPASAEGQAAAGPPEQATTEAWPVGRITAALWAATLLTALAAVALTLIAWDDLKLSDGISSLNSVVAAVAYATLGVLIIRRAANIIGWIMLAEGIGIAFFVLASAYAVTGVVAHPGTLPAARLAGTRWPGRRRVGNANARHRRWTGRAQTAVAEAARRCRSRGRLGQEVIPRSAEAMAVDREHSPDHPSRAAGRRSRACGSPRRRWQRCGFAEACGQLPSALIRRVGPGAAPAQGHRRGAAGLAGRASPDRPGAGRGRAAEGQLTNRGRGTALREQGVLEDGSWAAAVTRKGL